MPSLFGPRRVSKVTNLRVKEISAVDEPANQHALFILAKSKNGASTGLRLQPILSTLWKATTTDDGQSGVDMRSDDQKAADLDTVSSLALAKRPLPTEDYYAWTKRLFGEAGAARLFSDQDRILRLIFDTLKRHIEVRKRADDTLAEIAKSMQAADPNLTWAQAFTKAANTADGKRLYDAGRGRVKVEDEPEDENEDETDPDEVIKNRAAEIGAEQPSLSRYQAYTAAALENPDAYKRLRRRANRSG